MAEFFFGKVLFLSNEGVGKHTFFSRYCQIENNWIQKWYQILKLNELVKLDGKSVNLIIHDIPIENPTSEDQRFFFYHDVYGALIVYDITSSSSLNNITDWIQNIKNGEAFWRQIKGREGNIPLFLVGNKIDSKQNRSISKEEGRNLQKKHNFSYFIEVSFKTGYNVENLLNEFCCQLLNFHVR